VTDGVVTDRVQSLDWLLLAPVVVLVAALLAVLVTDAVLPGRRRLLDGLAVAGVLGAGAGLALAAAARDLPAATLCTSAGPCSYVTSGLTVALQGTALLAALVVLLLALDGPGARLRAEHHALLLAAVAGAVALAGARDLATMVVALETASLPVVGLVALRRDRRGAEAALKLLLVSVASLGVLLLGLALVYAAAGTVHLQPLAGAGAEVAGPHRALLLLGLGLVVAGAGFKLSAMPFGWWTPDVYAGSPPPVAALLSTVSKVAAAAFVLVLLVLGAPLLAGAWTVLVGVLAAVTMTVGNLVALRQRVAVRLLAWSTVAQAGWVLLPLAGAAAGLAPAARAAAGYLLAYVVASLAAFTVVVLVARHHPDGERHTLEAHRGLVRREPVAAVALAFALACLAGLPPGVMGLVAKVVALGPVVSAGGWLLAVVAAVNVALGLAYYLRWGALLLARPEEPDAGGPATPRPTWDVTVGEGLALGVSAGGCLALSVLPALVAGPFGGLLG